MRILGSPRTRLVWCAAAALLVLMLLLMLGSARKDALTWDEPAHIAAGYAYLRFQDGHLNPEHPPLLKMLASVPLLRLSLHFPLTSWAWQEDINGQWETARLFLYESGNDPHRMAMQARLMPMMLAGLLGVLLFAWMWHFAGESAALLTLFVYTFSPTILAHGRLVTMDVAAAFGVALAGCAFIQFLNTPGRTSALLAGLTLGIALLCKFSTILLGPFFVALTLLWTVLKPGRKGRYLWGIGIVSMSAALLVLLPYLWMTAQYPRERQLRDAYWTSVHWWERGPAGWEGHETAEEYFALLSADRTRDLRACIGLHTTLTLSQLKRCPLELVIFLADKPLWRAWGQYLFGLILTVQRASEGGTAAFPFYLLGEVATTGWWHYFPVVYAIRESLPFHILTTLALLLALRRVWSSVWGIRVVGSWLRCHAAETVMLGWIALYWGTALSANLNIGLRHLLPVFPFTFILVCREMSRWLTLPLSPGRPLSIRRGLPFVVIVVLLLWHGASVLRVYPSFLAYFNEAVGGPARGGDYTVDFDWGQDLRRLRDFVEARRIEKIAVDYFSSSSPVYELGEKFIPWRSALGPPQGWLAVSAAILHIAQGQWDPALGHPAAESYRWLRGKQPVAKIGYTIYVFHF